MRTRSQRAAIYGICLPAALFIAAPLAIGNEADSGPRFEGKPNPVLVADALSMSDLREVCFVSQYYSAANLLGPFGNRTVTGRKIPDNADYQRRTKADEIGIFVITDRDQKLIIVKSPNGGAPNGKDQGGCYRAEDARIWHWPDGSWYLNISDALQIYPFVGFPQ